MAHVLNYTKQRMAQLYPARLLPPPMNITEHPTAHIEVTLAPGPEPNGSTKLTWWVSAGRVGITDYLNLDHISLC